MKSNEAFSKKPLSYKGSIPVFSSSNEYTDNYEKISEDHLESLRRNGTNPFISEETWVQLENSTMELINKYSKPGDSVLDVGVGLGRLLSHFPLLHRYGMDISMGYLEIAHAKEINVCYALVEDMPYKRDLFDIVICTDVLEHVADLNLCCSKILSVLKQDGVLIVRVPFREDLNQYFMSTCPYKYVHLRNFDEASLRLLFERVFKCEFLDLVFAGYAVRPNRLKYPIRLPMRDIIFSLFFSMIKGMCQPVYEFMLKKLYYPIEINLVLRKKTEEN
ncbi:MAG: hypothetical protein A2157_05400 [Deltaproteobacteria bacterium RBG_16_47_11]|nr:MAG: hypothetical protein A2157_05400 [Deltaproteobacteria bacterium RBG_16_47_11]